MTTSQQRSAGRHARPAVAVEPSVPAQRPPERVRPQNVGEYVASVRAPRDVETTRDEEPGFGEWPYGPRRRPDADAARKPDTEPVGPNPYLPTDGAPATDVGLPPGGWPGTAALLMGAAGVALAMTPTTAAISWPMTILGVLLGVVGIRRVRRGAARNGVAAVTGTVFCLAGLVVCAGWIAMYTMDGLTTANPAATPAGVEQLLR